MALAMDKCTARVRVRDAHGDDVKVTIIKENKKIKIKYKSTAYGDFHKPKSNLYSCTNPVGVPILGWVMPDPLRSRFLLSPFSRSAPFPSSSLMQRESQKI